MSQIYLDQLRKFVRRYSHNEIDLEKFIHLCEMVNFNKGDVIIKEGVIQHNIYFLNKGIVRNFIYCTSGQIQTYNFRSESMVVSGYAHYNYSDDLRAKVNVECLEPCVMIKIPLTALQFMTDYSPNGDKIGRLLAENHVMELVDFILECDTKTIIERYYDLDKRYPNILQRVPQHIIASYLRTTAVHLSRLKNTIVNKC